MPLSPLYSSYNSHLTSAQQKKTREKLAGRDLTFIEEAQRFFEYVKERLFGEEYAICPPTQEQITNAKNLGIYDELKSANEEELELDKEKPSYSEQLALLNRYQRLWRGKNDSFSYDNKDCFYKIKQAYGEEIALFIQGKIASLLSKLDEQTGLNQEDNAKLVEFARDCFVRINSDFASAFLFQQIPDDVKDTHKLYVHGWNYDRADKLIIGPCREQLAFKQVIGEPLMKKEYQPLFTEVALRVSDEKDQKPNLVIHRQSPLVGDPLYLLPSKPAIKGPISSDIGSNTPQNKSEDGSAKSSLRWDGAQQSAKKNEKNSPRRFPKEGEPVQSPENPVSEVKKGAPAVPRKGLLSLEDFDKESLEALTQGRGSASSSQSVVVLREPKREKTSSPHTPKTPSAPAGGDQRQTDREIESSPSPIHLPTAENGISSWSSGGAPQNATKVKSSSATSPTPTDQRIDLLTSRAEGEAAQSPVIGQLAATRTLTGKDRSDEGEVEGAITYFADKLAKYFFDHDDEKENLSVGEICYQRAEELMMKKAAVQAAPFSVLFLDGTETKRALVDYGSALEHGVDQAADRLCEMVREITTQDDIRNYRLAYRALCDIKRLKPDYKPEEVSARLAFFKNHADRNYAEAKQAFSNLNQTVSEVIESICDDQLPEPIWRVRYAAKFGHPEACMDYAEFCMARVHYYEGRGIKESLTQEAATYYEHASDAYKNGYYRADDEQAKRLAAEVAFKAAFRLNYYSDRGWTMSVYLQYFKNARAWGSQESQRLLPILNSRTKEEIRKELALELAKIYIERMQSEEVSSPIRRDESSRMAMTFLELEHHASDKMDPEAAVRLYALYALRVKNKEVLLPHRNRQNVFQTLRNEAFDALKMTTPEQRERLQPLFLEADANMELEESK